MKNIRNNLSIAIVHDNLPLIGGAEKVLEQLTIAFPNADIYTLFDFLSEDQKEIFKAKSITASYLNKLPFVEKYYRYLLNLYPQAIESFDLSKYDLIISSSYCAAKGILTRADQPHISYIHSPARYAWDLMHQYLKQSNLQKGIKGFFAQNMLSKFRVWDSRTSNGVDHFISNSDYIAKRIEKIYRREAVTVYPPINTDYFVFNDQKEDFYLTASRLVPYKKVDLIAEAFSKMPEKKLKIIGSGPEKDKIINIADKCPNIEYLGYKEDDILADYMQKAKAFIFAAEEDFGIVPVEALSCGTPVICYNKGGGTETVIDIQEHPSQGTGIYFDNQTVESIHGAVNALDKHISCEIYKNCRERAEKFSNENFRKNMLDHLFEKEPQFFEAS